VGVNAKGEAWVGVTEEIGDGSDRLAGIDQDRGVEVAEGVHAVAATFVDPSLRQRRSPDGTATRQSLALTRMHVVHMPFAFGPGAELADEEGRMAVWMPSTYTEAKRPTLGDTAIVSSGVVSATKDRHVVVGGQGRLLPRVERLSFELER
jgi:hypothetical protein